MGKNKFRRFQENETFTNLFQPSFKELFTSDFSLKGQWREIVFGNTNPVVLELGCGKGEYAVALSRQYPLKNFIGIDIKGARIWRGAKTGMEENLTNLAFVRSKIECLTALFGENEIDEIWLTFPDPQPKKSRKRLTSPLFLKRYSGILKKNATIHLKTDSQMLHYYTKALVSENNLPMYISTDNLYPEIDRYDSILKVQTAFEKLFVERGKNITYLQFGLENSVEFVEPSNFDETVFERYNSKKEKVQ